MALIIQDSKNTKLIENGQVSLTDANNKVIVVNMDDINDASTYGSNDASRIQDQGSQAINIQSVITDSEGTVMDEESLIDSVKSGDITALDVTFEATHSGKRINYALYNSESMAEDYASFIYPFTKPLIKNHDRHTEPLGRAIDANFDKSEFLQDSDTINVTWRVSDSDAMLKFADGRYKTMSIGAGAKKIVCNTCGKTILTDNKLSFCGHWRGETYKDSVCTWTMTQLDYREGSVVNDPADEFAQVKRIKVLRKGDSKMSNAAKTTDPKAEPVNNSAAVSDVDAILNGTTPAAATPTDPTPPATDPATEATDAEKLATALAELQVATDALEVSKTEIATRDSEIETLKVEKDVADADITTKKEQLITMAKLNKQLLTDNLMVLNPEIKDEEIADKTASELNQMITDIRNQPRVPGKVNNPAMQSNDNNTITDEKKEPKTARTMKDMEDIVSKLIRV